MPPGMPSASHNRLAGRELWRRLLGDDAFRDTRGVLNDAIAVYFADATLASAFVASWCVGFKVEAAGGVFQVREGEPVPRIGAGLHRTP